MNRVRGKKEPGLAEQKNRGGAAEMPAATCGAPPKMSGIVCLCPAIGTGPAPSAPSGLPPDPLFFAGKPKKFAKT